MEITNEILDVLEKPGFDNSIESYQYVTYEPASQHNLNNRGTPIVIDINADDKYSHPSHSYLHIKGQLIRADNQQAYLPENEITLVNNAMMYLFSNITYEVGGKTMESINCPGHTTSLIGYLSYPDDFNSSEGLMSCWSKDTSEHAISIKYAQIGEGANRRPTENPHFNKGFSIRKKMIMDSNPRGSFSFIIPFGHIFGFADYNKVLYNVKQTLRLTRCSDDRLAIHRADTVPDGIVELSEISWRIPELEIEPKTLTDLTKHITDKKNFPIHFTGRYCESLEVTAGTTQFSWRVSVTSGIEKPRWLIIGFQTNRNRSQDQNPTVFDHVNLETCFVTLNSKQYPVSEIKSNFATNDYSRLYEMMCSFKREHFGFNNLIGGTQIDMYAFKKLFPIIVLDVRRQKDKLKSGVVDMQLKFFFREGIPANTVAYTIILSDRLFNLQSDGSNLKVINY